MSWASGPLRTGQLGPDFKNTWSTAGIEVVVGLGVIASEARPLVVRVHLYLLVRKSELAGRSGSQRYKRITGRDKRMVPVLRVDV